MNKNKITQMRSYYSNIKDMLDTLLDDSYDFNKVNIDENVFLDFLSNNGNKEFEKITKEKKSQDLVINKAKRIVLTKYSDSVVLNCKIKNYDGFYYVEVIGHPFRSVKCIFYKNGDLLEIISKSDGWIDIIDDRNYFIFERKDNHVEAAHKRIDSTNTTCLNIYLIKGIVSNIFRFHEFNNLISWVKVNDLEKKVLYDYKVGNILIPEFNSRVNDYGLFSNVIDKEGLFRFVTSYKIGILGCNLEYLVDKDGILCTDVYDFEREISYSREKRGDTQLEILNSIFEEAKNNMKKEISVLKKIYSNKKVK